MKIQIKQPETEQEWKDYYNLRWRILRAPWGEPEGSEKDELENQCLHVMACDDSNTIIGIGRLQFNSDSEAQIRYMAVEPGHEGNGIGRLIVKQLEKHAADKDYDIMVLHAREPAMGFYQKLGYVTKEKSYLLFDCIQHYHMYKLIG